MLAGHAAGDIDFHGRPLAPGAFGAVFTPRTSGRHRLFVTVLRATGERETLVVEADVTESEGDAAAAGTLSPGTWDARAPALSPSAPEARSEVEVGEGLRLRWRREEPSPLPAREVRRLEFELVDAAGEPVGGLEALEGVAGLLEVMSADGEVFNVVTPAGTAAGGRPATPSDEGVVGFPHGFPGAGVHRLWVSVRHGGLVRTASFDVLVE